MFPWFISNRAAPPTGGIDVLWAFISKSLSNPPPPVRVRSRVADMVLDQRLPLLPPPGELEALLLGLLAADGILD